MSQIAGDTPAVPDRLELGGERLQPHFLLSLRGPIKNDKTSLTVALSIQPSEEMVEPAAKLLEGIFNGSCGESACLSDSAEQPPIPTQDTGRRQPV